MNNKITFEQGIKEIPANEEALSLSWVTGISKQVKQIDEMKEDNFFATDTDSITNTIEMLNAIDQVVVSTNMYYLSNPEKKQLMSEIIEGMTLLKTMKTGLDSNILRTSITNFNDNLEVAQKKYYRKYLRNLCETYNRSGNKRLIKAKYLFDTQSGFERRVELGRFEGDKWVSKTVQIKNTEKVIPSMTEYDTINYNGLLGSDSEETFGGILSFLKHIDKSNEEMQRELKKRKISYIEIKERPNDTR